MSNLLDLLLRPEVPDVSRDLPTKQVKVKRLSELLKEDVVFTVRALPYGRVEDIKGTDGDTAIPILLAGLVNPDPKDDALQKRFGGATPAETLKRLLLPGEIEDLSREVEKLSGYRAVTIEEIKNVSGTETTQS